MNVMSRWACTVILCLVPLAACYSVNETAGPAAANVVNHRLRLKRDAFVWHAPGFMAVWCIVPVQGAPDLPPDVEARLSYRNHLRGSAGLPPSVEAWRADPAAWPGIEDALRPGTELRVAKVRRFWEFENGTHWDVWGALPSGAWADEDLLVNDLFLLPKADGDLLLADPALLEVLD